MKLPNADKAMVDREKIADYLLNASHPNNGGKAESFQRFGFRRDDWQVLANALLNWRAKPTFGGYPWHTHPELLASASVSPEAATRQFVVELLASRTVIAVSRTGGAIRDVWITDDTVAELKYKAPDETLEFRYWNGRRAPDDGAANVHLLGDRSFNE